ncbi:hypothetical protein CcaverHIS002_0301340 [Cutaneotrichosporon cavernicola]|uniref:Uncharacterized protein n=1 Tax=Cutaneotrichosporon cavernicola TaxID=279322 RepID=A0AA48IAG6_9TREE|nr:uncharacterized protein CcaverHIS019_0301300 [Cutaneotrichosporon cavernicola]BEI82266.1 hypothetical protein CcaverHIS002_0301340 [Cutaneotrichosporon cavernicola]BEI90060.1 hypothetical protein CcaverHIS019_0301300 [Cutaneotrichosporon cavernicola]BEI97834.1 hypothetical protein CcaverHIS631_0301330 [Cutaneotrichosporon cavernicola]BEJ05611.1 hypothetical protein CcaverHIS641_0301330 [Cutaneotrichosporon cavernicola]
MKLILFLPLVAAAPLPGFKRWSYLHGYYPAAQPAQPTQPAAPPAPPPNPHIPPIYQNATDWWVAGTFLHGKWRSGQWDGTDNTAGAVMYVDDKNVAVTVVPL